MKNTFISLDLLQTFLFENSSEKNDSIAFLIEKNQLLEKVNFSFSEGKKLKINERELELNEVQNFVSFISNDENLVFLQWIKNSKNLEKLLLSECKVQFLANDFLMNNYKDHFLLKSFQHFISPFLLEKLIPKLEKTDLINLEKVSTYISILNSDAALIIQDKINSIFKNDWRKIEEKLIQIKSEKELILVIGSYFSQEKITILNNFTKEFYRSKVELIEQGTTLFQHKFSSNRIVFWIISQLNLVNLNEEHRNHLKEIHESIKNGEAKYFKYQPKISSSWTLLNKIIFPILAVSLGVLIYVIFTWKEKEAKLSENSAFKNFSVNERKLMDSLIQSMEHKTESDEPVLDQGNAYLHLSPIEIDLKSRTEFKNQFVEDFIQNNLKIQELILQGNVDSCEIYSDNEIKKLKFDGFKSVNQSTGNKTLFLKNESSYQVTCLLFENKMNVTPYVYVLLPNQEVNFKAKTGQHFVFLPGSNLGEIHLNETSNDIKNYKHHFCFTDENFDNQLLTSYKIKAIEKQKIKLLFNENSSKQFYFVDLSEALEEVE